MQVRAYRADDHETVLALADRLVEGVAPWRDPTAVLTAVRGWVGDSIAAVGRDGHAVFVAAESTGLLGFVSVGERAHFSGCVDAYVGELVVARSAQGRGVGRALMARAEQWGRERGHAYLTLETGAANARARAFYTGLGYLDEDVRLTKPLR